MRLTLRYHSRIVHFAAGAIYELDDFLFFLFHLLYRIYTVLNLVSKLASCMEFPLLPALCSASFPSGVASSHHDVVSCTSWKPRRFFSVFVDTIASVYSIAKSIHTHMSKSEDLVGDPVHDMNGR